MGLEGDDGALYLEILENAEVSITTTRDIAYTGNYLRVSIAKNAVFNVNTKYGSFRDNGHQASSILVDEGAIFSIVQTQTNGSYATISCRGDFVVNKNATLYIESNYQNSAPNILFNTTSSKTTVISSNLTETEQEALPQLSFLTFQTAKTLRFMEAGNLVLKNEQSVIEFQRPLISTNPLILGRKEKTITMTVVDSRAVSVDWYLYAYIEAPLSTSDNKYTLTDSLIFIDENNEIKTLEKTLTLIYTGTKNDGNTKTTMISWKENNGILFKVIEPLYNGKTYKTTINWILTNEKIERKLNF